ncbi:outer membrane protein assembly factor BamB family protein [Geodermatophilus sp. SYSU D01105]
MWVWTAATLALVVVAALLWRGSDAAATESTTAAPAGVPDGTPAGAVSPAWTSPTATSGDVPRATVHGGRVLVGGAHGVRALDVGTGAEGWHYTRANARLCDWTAVGSVVVAVFRTEDRCDEAVALAADTGVRQWTRNVDLRTDMVLRSTDGIVLAAAPTGVVTLDPVGDNTRWRQAPTPGCRLLGADVGEAGVVVLQRCAETAALQLRLFDGYTGEAAWTRDVPDTEATLVGVDRTVAVAGSAGVQLFAGGDGVPVGSPVSGAGPVLVRGAGEVLLVLAGGTLSAVEQDTGAVRWSTPATGLPGGPAEGGQPAAEAAVPVPEDGAVVLRDLVSGEEVGRASATGVPTGGVATVTGPVVVVQLADRVLTYR